MTSKIPRHKRVKVMIKGKAYLDDHEPDNEDCICFGCTSARTQMESALEE